MTKVYVLRVLTFALGISTIILRADNPDAVLKRQLSQMYQKCLERRHNCQKVEIFLTLSRSYFNAARKLTLNTIDKFEVTSDSIFSDFIEKAQEDYEYLRPAREEFLTAQTMMPKELRAKSYDFVLKYNFFDIHEGQENIESLKEILKKACNESIDECLKIVEKDCRQYLDESYGMVFVPEGTSISFDVDSSELFEK